MIRITIEKVPHRNAERAYVIAQGVIYKDGRGSMAGVNYGAQITRMAHSRTLPGGGWWKKGKIKDFPRTSLSVWDLLYRALRELVGERNP